jgi:peptide/nickel transport system permease protein
MGRFVIKRLLMMIPIVLAVTFIIFFIMDFSSSNIAYLILGADNATDEAVAKLNASLGLDKPLLYRYGKYIYDIVVNHSLGNSYTWNRPVWDDVMAKLPVSVIVSFNGMLVATLIGLPVGIFSAVKQYSATDKVATVSSLFISAIPGFWLAMMLMLLFSLKLRLLPTSGIANGLGYILPAFSLGIPYAAIQLRYTRSSMLETIRQEFVDTARSKGVPERVVIWKHALKNALLPVITVTGTNFGGLIGGAVVTETIFALPGVGYFMMTGINSRDIPIVCGCVVVLATLYSLVMLLIDLMHAMIDPRIKARYAQR